MKLTFDIFERSDVDVEIVPAPELNGHKMAEVKVSWPADNGFSYATIALKIINTYKYSANSFTKQGQCSVRKLAGTKKIVADTAFLGGISGHLNPRSAEPRLIRFRLPVFVLLKEIQRKVVSEGKRERTNHVQGTQS